MIFNSPIEHAFRILIILDKLSPEACVLQKLIYYDYFILYPSDSPLKVDKKMHSTTPYRGIEIAVKRKIIQKALLILQQKGLVEKIYTADGIKYKATRVAKPFLRHFSSNYYINFNALANEVVEGLSKYTSDEIELYIKNNIANWGTEFISESLFRGEHIE